MFHFPSAFGFEFTLLAAVDLQVMLGLEKFIAIYPLALSELGFFWLVHKKGIIFFATL